MARRKVKLAFITKNSARKATYKKRKKFLLKKVSELGTLCGIQACGIIFSPYDPEPEVWPSPLGVQRVISQFNKVSEIEKTGKMLEQETFLRQRIAKLSIQLRKQQIKNHEKEITLLMFHALATGEQGLQSLNLQDLNDLHRKIDAKMKEIHERLMAINLPPLP